MRWLRRAQCTLKCAALALVLIAPAAKAEVTDHAFGFDLRYDNQDAEVLDYRYGDSKSPVRAPEDAVSEGRTFLSANVNGPILRGDSLYVKWRDKATGEVREETVDLRGRLPVDLAGSRIHFVIKESQLYVYLISRAPRPPDMPPNGPRMYQYRITTTIYPDPEKP